MSDRTQLIIITHFTDPYIKPDALEGFAIVTKAVAERDINEYLTREFQIVAVVPGMTYRHDVQLTTATIYLVGPADFEPE